MGLSVFSLVDYNRLGYRVEICVGPRWCRCSLILAGEHGAEVLVAGLGVAKHAQHVHAALRGGRRVQVPAGPARRPVAVLPPHTRRSGTA